jgi:sigma-B regulation protein RsbU (phosphoserine phosphatase)
VTFEENTKADLKKGQLLILATDGVWESRDAQGNMFGKDRIYEIIRQHAHQSSQVILDTLIDALDNHMNESKSEDDITLVVIKFTR